MAHGIHADFTAPSAGEKGKTKEQQILQTISIYKCLYFSSSHMLKLSGTQYPVYTLQSQVLMKIFALLLCSDLKIKDESSP